MRHSPTHRAQLDKGGVRVRALTEEVTTKREVKHVEELSGPGRGGWVFQAEGKAHGKNPQAFKVQVSSGGGERPWS